jgi:hypothetical protein
MRKLPLPTDDPSHVFLTCISRVADQAFKARLTAIEPDIVSASTNYRAAGVTATFHTIIAQTHVGAQITAGRPTYDKLKTTSPQGRCPLCGQRDVSTLDHYLPKMQHPALAVTPANLVPACPQCNKVKLGFTPTGAGQQTLHPYFDDVDGIQWLRAALVPNIRALHFFAAPPETTPPLLAGRIRFHFQKFELATLYASHSASQLENMKGYLAVLYSRATMAGVRQHLQEMAGSCRAIHLNSWETVMYETVALSDWFCDGGFSQ